MPCQWNCVRCHPIDFYSAEQNFEMGQLGKISGVAREKSVEIPAIGDEFCRGLRPCKGEALDNQQVSAAAQIGKE